MTQGEFPPPPMSEARPMASGVNARATVGEPWHKPTLYDLTDYIDTGGNPTNKDHGGSAPKAEDESRPHAPTRRKRYRPISA